MVVVSCGVVVVVVVCVYIVVAIAPVSAISRQYIMIGSIMISISSTISTSG